MGNSLCCCSTGLYVLVFAASTATPLQATRAAHDQHMLFRRNVPTKLEQVLVPSAAYEGALLEIAVNQSVLQRTYGDTRSDSREIVTATIGIVFAIISIVTAIWDLWEKWNAIIMLRYALMRIEGSDWSQLQKYKRYEDITFCMRDRVDEAIDTMSVVATYFKLLHYAETQCARPDVHLDWLTTTKRCTRDYATERIEEMHTEICSAQYGEGLFSTVDMLMDETLASPAIDGCECVRESLCSGKSWCNVDGNSTCPDKRYDIFSGYYSYIPCEVSGMHSEDKARSLLKATCTVCNVGFLRNAGLIENKLFAGLIDPDLKGKDIRDDKFREAVKLRYFDSAAVTPDHQDVTVIVDDEYTTIEHTTYLEILKWERLRLFDRRCNDFKASMSIGERTLMTGEDLVNEKIYRLLWEGRLDKAATGIEWEVDKVGKHLEKAARAFRNAGDDKPPPLESTQQSSLLAELQSTRSSLERLEARRTSGDLNLQRCSDLKILSQDQGDLEQMARETSNVIAASECAAVEGAVSRFSAWRRLGVQCKCKAYSHKVYCGEKLVAQRKFRLKEIDKVGCDAKLYCSKFSKTSKQVNFLVMSRLGCAVIPGAQDAALNSVPYCKCKEDKHILFCGSANFGRGTYFNLDDDVLSHPYCQESPQCNEPTDLSIVANLTELNKKWDGCQEVIGARAVRSLLKGMVGSDCKCSKGEQVFCGTERVRGGRYFKKQSLLSDGCSEFLYCSSVAMTDKLLLQSIRTEASPQPQTSVRQGQRAKAYPASLIQLRSIKGDALQVLLWVPMQVARVVQITTQGVIDWGLAIWWFAFNNIYGSLSTWEAFDLLAKATKVWDTFVQWTGIISFFVWLLNDLIFIGWNTAMCPRISNWIEIMDGVRADSGASINRGSHTGVTRDFDLYSANSGRVDGSTKHGQSWCATKLENVTAEMQREAIERTIVLRQVAYFQQELPAAMPPGLNVDQELLESLKIDEKELKHQLKSLAWERGRESGLRLSKIHEDITKHLKNRLSPAALCPIADQVLEFPWRDSPTLGEVFQRRLEDIACRCEPRPRKCGGSDDDDERISSDNGAHVRRGGIALSFWLIANTFLNR